MVTPNGLLLGGDDGGRSELGVNDGVRLGVEDDAAKTVGVDRGAATVLPEQADRARQAPRTTSRRMRRTLSTPRRQVRPSLVIGGDYDAGQNNGKDPNPTAAALVSICGSW